MDNLQTARCPMCKEEVEIEDGLSVGDMTYCPECGAELRIVKVSPPHVEEFDSFDEK